MKHRIALTALGLTAFAVAPVAAQTIPNVPAVFGTGYTVAPGVTEAGPTGGAYYVGPYTGTIQLGSTVIPVQFNCVDFFHDVVNGQPWTATLSNLGSGDGVGTNTRLSGNVTIPTTSTTVSALDVYRAAAYLISTYPGNPPANAAQTVTIQNEIWEATSLFYPQVGQASYAGAIGDNFTTGVVTRSDNYSFNMPLTASGLASMIMADDNVAGFDYANYWVVTIQTGKDGLNSPQEFIIHQNISTTPEPATLALFGSGMIGLFMVRRRRNR